jgi:outer membrane lipoprotein SlyB
MKSFIAITAVVVALACPMTAAFAGERENDAALGAGSGLLVGGPVGLVAGGVIGYVAGPEIRRGMGVHHHRTYQRRVYRDTNHVYR